MPSVSFRIPAALIDKPRLPHNPVAHLRNAIKPCFLSCSHCSEFVKCFQGKGSEHSGNYMQYVQLGPGSWAGHSYVSSLECVVKDAGLVQDPGGGGGGGGGGGERRGSGYLSPPIGFSKREVSQYPVKNIVCPPHPPISLSLQCLFCLLAYVQEQEDWKIESCALNTSLNDGKKSQYLPDKQPLRANFPPRCFSDQHIHC